MKIDAVVMRHQLQVRQTSYSFIDAIIINAGDGTHEHPHKHFRYDEPFLKNLEDLMV
ncbi:hypothetical protein Ct9H90mP29_17450 [bacterium]|nr:MAG: hypothetical protein Ct9H90mP29_17450 [bacterium]